MNASPQHPNSTRSDHSFFHRPLVIAIGIALVWVILVIASDQMWQHAFGFPTWDAVALAVGLFAYLALFAGVMFGIIWMLGHEHMSNS
jgi:hypothetical protein